MDFRSKYQSLVTRLFNWEYWPLYITNFPVVGFWLWQSVRAGNFFFFSSINPSIATGGFFGESKKDIYDLIPGSCLPKTIYISSDHTTAQVEDQMHKAEIAFPIILKPDVGERGFNVARIASTGEMADYLDRTKHDVILQEYVDEPLEFSILCYEFPVSKAHGITSVCQKEFLSVTGDGHSTLEQLILKKPRAILQLKTLRQVHRMSDIPGAGTRVLLEPIGNHCRGTKFLNANHLIDEHLCKVLNDMLTQMPDVAFGRFDLRARSVEDLKAGRHFKVLEFNGVGSEPGHIYDPEYPIWRAYRDLWRHWSIMRQIAVEQRKLGHRPMRFLEVWRALRAYFGYKKAASMAISSS